MANAVISDVQTKCSNSVSERAKRTAIAEARLMRACAYFYMVRLWVQLSSSKTTTKWLPIPCNRSTAKKMCWKLVIRDLTYAVENLPEVATAKGRVNAWVKACLPKSTSPAQAGKVGTRDNADLEKAKELAPT